MYKLSNTVKMPGKSFSIPAQTCKVGSKLALTENSVCTKCYAKKGSYCYPAAKNLRQHNFDHYIANPDTFVGAMETLIQAEYLTTGVPYFRWFDSGDLQSTEMLKDIIRIAYLLPHIQFWLPTKEVNVVKTTVKDFVELDLHIPCNLAIRLSVHMVDGKYLTLPTELGGSISQTRVISKNTKPLETEIVCSGDCVECNYICWGHTNNVAYIQH